MNARAAGEAPSGRQTRTIRRSIAGRVATLTSSPSCWCPGCGISATPMPSATSWIMTLMSLVSATIRGASPDGNRLAFAK
jgi:hypothetical protein